MATQDIVDSAGLGQRIPVLEQREQQTLKKIEGLEGRQAEISEREIETVKKRSEETAPVRESLRKKLGEVPPYSAKEEPTPKYQRPTMTPQELQQSFGMLLAASFLVGKNSRGPYNSMMSAMTGAMNGFRQQDERMVNESLRVFDKNLTSIKERNAQKRREVEAAFKAYQHDLSALKTELELVAAKYDDQMLLAAAQRKSLGDQTKLAYTQLNSTERAIASQVRTLEYFRSHQEAEAGRRERAGEAAADRKERAAETARHNRETERAARDREERQRDQTQKLGKEYDSKARTLHQNYLKNWNKASDERKAELTEQYNDELGALQGGFRGRGLDLPEQPPPALTTAPGRFFGTNKLPPKVASAPVQPGAAPTQPKGTLPMPETKEELEPGSVYQTARGPAKWNGKEFEAQ